MKRVSIILGCFWCIICKNRELWIHRDLGFCGYIFYKPSREHTRPLELSRGLKGLLHMLNATVITYGSGTRSEEGHARENELNMKKQGGHHSH